jgi:hypothetical protein
MHIPQAPLRVLGKPLQHLITLEAIWWVEAMLLFLFQSTFNLFL